MWCVGIVEIVTGSPDNYETLNQFFKTESAFKAFCSPKHLTPNSKAVIINLKEL